MAYDRKPAEIKPAKATKKDYAEKPFSVYDLKMSGDEVTIEEALNFESSCPRIIQVKNYEREGTHDAVGITVSNGLFKKDLALTDNDWTKLCASLPSSLITLQGVKFKITSGVEKRSSKFIFLGVARQDLDGNQYNNASNFAQDKPGQANEAPTEIGKQIQALIQGMETTARLNIPIDSKTMTTMADGIRPGDALKLIQETKDMGWIFEQTDKQTGKTIFRVAN